MSSVVHPAVSSPCPNGSPPGRKRRVGSAIALFFAAFAFIVVACSGGDGQPDEGAVIDTGEQEQPICTQDDCEPPPREPCGTEGNACCRLNNRCATGLVCSQGICTTCGTPGGPCCANNVCQSGSACQNGTCVRTCGAQGLACCNGTTCDSGLACAGGTCQPCGRGGQTCCAGNTCSSGFNCNSGTCRACGGNGQACCASGAACGGGLFSGSNGTCQPVPCGTAFGTCCPGLDWQKCQLAGSQYACNTQNNRCEPCGSTGGPCCTSGSPCTFSSNNVCVASPFGGGTCQRCGGNGDVCCSGNTCQIGSVCSSSTGRCTTCGGRYQPCCSGFTQCQSGLSCQFGQCQ